jgi:hypothetical protein
VFTHFEDLYGWLEPALNPRERERLRVFFAQRS